MKVSGSQPFCGDGNIDTPFEICDSANRTCGICAAACTVVVAQGSTGFIFAAKADDYRPNASSTHDTFKLNDGFLEKTFELVIGTRTGSNILVPIAAGENNAQVAARIALQINLSGLSINATSAGSMVTLTNLVITVRGDVPITNNVATTNFAVSGMSVSKGGNCAGGQPCTLDVDCASADCILPGAATVGVCAP